MDGIASSSIGSSASRARGPSKPSIPRPSMRGARFRSGSQNHPCRGWHHVCLNRERDMRARSRSSRLKRYMTAEPPAAAGICAGSPPSKPFQFQAQFRWLSVKLVPHGSRCLLLCTRQGSSSES
jgi:hypothetical protein